MKIEQEPKYNVNAKKQLYNRETGNIIPDDEPIFILRARDKHANEVLNYYWLKCKVKEHKDAVEKRIFDFIKFKEKNPERMREPGEFRKSKSENS